MADGLHVTDRNRPDDALALSALFIAIAQRDLAARVYLVAYARHVEAIGGEAARWRCFGGRLEHIGPKPFRYDGADLGDQILGRPGQGRIAVAGHPLGAEHGSLDLVGRQHQRRQVQPRLQNVADPGLAADRYPLADKVRDIAIDRPLGGLELGGECRGGYRSGRPAQDLDDLKKPVGASHRPLSLDDADSMLAAVWQ